VASPGEKKGKGGDTTSGKGEKKPCFPKAVFIQKGGGLKISGNKKKEASEKKKKKLRRIGSPAITS